MARLFYSTYSFISYKSGDKSNILESHMPCFQQESDKKEKYKPDLLILTISGF